MARVLTAQDLLDELIALQDQGIVLDDVYVYLEIDAGSGTYDQGLQASFKQAEEPGDCDVLELMGMTS